MGRPKNYKVSPKFMYNPVNYLIYINVGDKKFCRMDILEIGEPAYKYDYEYLLEKTFIPFGKNRLPEIQKKHKEYLDAAKT